MHHMQYVEQLTLIGMEALGLNIKNRIRIDVDMQFILHIFSEAQLVSPLNLPNPLDKAAILGIFD
ncbi:hypothetical protein D3C77_607250 [compost metagenome]